MLKIEATKHTLPFKDLEPMELFYRENEKDVYYSYIDARGMFTAVNLSTGEEPDNLGADEKVTRIQGTLKVF